MSEPLSIKDCTKLLDALLLLNLTWEWDSRLKTSLTTISTDEQSAIKEILENYLGKAWDSSTIEAAPESVQQILIQFGGLMPGQFFYAADLPEEGVCFCAWWPWGNGQTISIRIGTKPERSHLLDKLTTPKPVN